jgi:NAD+ kinase
MREHGASTALLVTLGGDGTFLYGARLAAPLGIPVVGVNRGRLGFLNDVEIDALPGAISRFAAGDYTTQRRALLEISIAESEEPVLAINEIVVRARDVNVVRLRVDVDDDLLGAFDADGVVVATATGSTAYALSAGGPPVDPRVRAVVVVPLAAHAVISRPVVIPEQLDVRVTVERGRVFVAADGRSVAWLADGGSVVIRPGPELEVVRFADSPSFNSRLRQKFRYGIPHKDLLLEPIDDDLPGEQRRVSGPS